MAIELFIGFASLVMVGACLGGGIVLSLICYNESFRGFIKREIYRIEHIAEEYEEDEYDI